MQQPPQLPLRPSLPPEMWYIIFQMRTKLIIEEHYSNWLKNYTQFNENILKKLKFLYFEVKIEARFSRLF